MNYNPQEIEKKWQEKWEKDGIYRIEGEDSAKPKKYILGMFPYPSGAGLHVGHCRIFTAVDVLARWHRMKGFNVLDPQGWDAFGLPAENDAIKKKVNPNELVPVNIANFKRQCQMMGWSYDWDREINTSAVEYYKWTQWLFLQLYQAGHLYQADVPINWCAQCQTGLADEEVLAGGIHERCGKPVVKKEMKQWLFKITAYADRLLEDLEVLDWPEGILEMQRNWIGKSKGAKIRFVLEKNLSLDGLLEVFTTRPDTIFGVTAIVLAPEHPLVKKIVSAAGKEKAAAEKYLEETKRKSDLERTDLQKKKTGVFTGFYCLNPISKERIPIWIGDYVIGWYGGGAVMVVPAHDARDFAFAKEYGIEIKQVIGSEESEKPYTDYGLLINSGEYSGLKSEEAMAKIVEDLKDEDLAEETVSYHLRDWIFSRQHYWGEPIPLIHCPKCGVVLVPENDLPVKLPYIERYEPSGTGESPLSAIPEWVNTQCPKCGGKAKRETDTMPNWAGSCWYFLRFADSQNNKKPFDKKKVDFWHPVDWYVGGAEHAVLHLLYARYWTKAFYNLGLISFKEPFQKLSDVGMVSAEDGRKMSKSLGNVINPDDIAGKYGVDTLRIYEMFMGPFSQATAWSTKSMAGCRRFLERIWRLADEKIASGAKTPLPLKQELNQLVWKVGSDIEKMKFNTAIAAMMEFTNSWAEDENQMDVLDAKDFLIVLAPFAPHLTEELWEKLGGKYSIHQQSWPEYNPELVKKETEMIIVQINGKMRDKIKVASGMAEPEVRKMVFSSGKIKKWLNSKEPKNIIFVPGKLINIVI